MRRPPPWTVEKIPGGLKVVSVACVRLFTRECERRRYRQGLTEDEARRIASNIAKLPALLGSALPDDAVNNLSDERHEAEDTTPE
jgi:hypothetical protein